MERTEVLSKIQEILADAIDNEDLVLSETSSPSSVDDWDSLVHFNMIMELQSEYGVRFGTAEIQGLCCVGYIITSIIAKV